MLAADTGFEPVLPVPETGVLPLDESAKSLLSDSHDNRPATADRIQRQATTLASGRLAECKVRGNGTDRHY